MGESTKSPAGDVVDGPEVRAEIVNGSPLAPWLAVQLAPW